MRVSSKLGAKAVLRATAVLIVGASVLATAASAATAAATAPLPTPPGFGPLQVGLSLEQIRAATPGVEWTASRPLKYSGQPTEFTANDVLVADRPFDVQISARHHGAYNLTLAHVYAAPDADHCEQTARAIFAVIEPQTGPMYPPGEMFRGEESESLGARSTVKLSQVLSTADYKPISRAKLKGRKPAQRWLRATTGISGGPYGNLIIEDDLAGSTTASFSMDYEQQAGNEACRIRLEAHRAAKPPAPLELPVGALATVKTPSISQRHFEISRLAISVTLPPGGIELNVRCKVDRDTGKTRDCLPADRVVPGGTIAGLSASPAREPNPSATSTMSGRGLLALNGAGGLLATTALPPPAPPLSAEALAVKARQTASRLARTYQFDMAKVAGLDRDDPQPVLLDIPVRLTPSDIREVIPTGPAASATQAGFRWATRAPAHVLEQLYPKRALRQEEQTNVALVCELQEDFSAVCTTANQEPRPAPDFEWAAFEILTYYTAEPKTTSGTPTPGIQFLQNLQFRLQ